MSNSKRKWWLTAALVVCLATGAFADHDRHRCDPHRRDCQQVPEGGSAVTYLLGAGLACFGAMFLRSRTFKPAQ